MCGIFGLIALQGTKASARAVDVFCENAKLASRRGSDASGLILRRPAGDFDIVKSSQSIDRLLASSKMKIRGRRGADVLAGHSRLETHGFSSDSANNQPIVFGDWLVLHNGIITNHKSIKDELVEDLSRVPESDSVAIAVLLSNWVANGRVGSIDDDVFRICEGELSVLAFSTWGEVIAYSNVGNLYFAHDTEGNLHLGSEPRQLEHKDLSDPQQFSVNTTHVIESGLRNAPSKFEVVEVSEANSHRRSAKGLHLESSSVSREFRNVVGRLSEMAVERANEVVRCRKCLLPATFPGLLFNVEGVCELCDRFMRPTFRGAKCLQDDLQQSSPDSKTLLVCLSGGRDSCYVLHMVKELGFRPLAYTYDWGMVTTAARENMARMCGKLGVEHILVSPNINLNRQRVGRALRAWIKRPDLATLPVLMAGDKPYFRYSQIVAKERGGIPAVMADHHLETTGFKSSLAGATLSFDTNGGVSYRQSGLSLIRMGLRYIGGSLKNPALAPAVFTEGTRGFVDYYLRKHEFVRPFEYVEWDEAEIANTLESEYGWSKGSDPNLPAWRMGDATAPFYNLVYLLSLGMSEHDALRSNQIRYGLVDRTTAAKMCESDNKPSDLAMAMYFATAGFSEPEATSALNHLFSRGKSMRIG